MTASGSSPPDELAHWTSKLQELRLLGATLAPLFPELSAPQACAIAVCAHLAANYNAPLTGVALAAEWGGAGLLKDAWVAVLIAAWIGEGVANTPAKKGTRHLGTIHEH